MVFPVDFPETRPLNEVRLCTYGICPVITWPVVRTVQCGSPALPFQGAASDTLWQLETCVKKLRCWTVATPTQYGHRRSCTCCTYWFLQNMGHFIAAYNVFRHYLTIATHHQIIFMIYCDLKMEGPPWIAAFKALLPLSMLPIDMRWGLAAVPAVLPGVLLLAMAPAEVANCSSCIQCNAGLP